jgi:hypothetical protein
VSTSSCSPGTSCAPPTSTRGWTYTREISDEPCDDRQPINKPLMADSLCVIGAPALHAEIQRPALPGNDSDIPNYVDYVVLRGGKGDDKRLDYNSKTLTGIKHCLVYSFIKPNSLIELLVLPTSNCYWYTTLPRWTNHVSLTPIVSPPLLDN